MSLMHPRGAQTQSTIFPPPCRVWTSACASPPWAKGNVCLRRTRRSPRSINSAMIRRRLLSGRTRTPCRARFFSITRSNPPRANMASPLGQTEQGARPLCSLSRARQDRWRRSQQLLLRALLIPHNRSTAPYRARGERCDVSGVRLPRLPPREVRRAARRRRRHRLPPRQ